MPSYAGTLHSAAGKPEKLFGADMPSNTVEEGQIADATAISQTPLYWEQLHPCRKAVSRKACQACRTGHHTNAGQESRGLALCQGAPEAAQTTEGTGSETSSKATAPAKECSAGKGGHSPFSHRMLRQQQRGLRRPETCQRQCQALTPVIDRS